MEACTVSSWASIGSPEHNLHPNQSIKNSKRKERELKEPKSTKQQMKTTIRRFNSPSRGFTRPELFQSNSTSGTTSVGAFCGWRIAGGASAGGLEAVELGFNGSIGLKLRLVAKRGMFDEFEDEDEAH